MKKTLFFLLAVITLASCSKKELRDETEPAPAPTLPSTCVCGEIVYRTWGENNTRWYWMQSDCTGDTAIIRVHTYFYDMNSLGDHICLDQEEVFDELVPW
jgi:hypothetical protein